VTTAYATNNQHMVDVSVAAVKDNGVPRMQVQCRTQGNSRRRTRAVVRFGVDRQSQSHSGPCRNRRTDGVLDVNGAAGFSDVNLFLTQMVSASDVRRLILADPESKNRRPALLAPANRDDRGSLTTSTP
jgi:hypothetical protein